MFDVCDDYSRGLCDVANPLVALQLFCPDLVRVIAREDAAFIDSFRRSVAINFRKLIGYAQRRYERLVEALMEIPDPWVIGLCDEWEKGLRLDARAFMYRVVFATRSVGVLDFVRECMIPIENNASDYVLFERSQPYVQQCKRRIRAKIQPPVLSPSLELDLREALSRFEAIGQVWAWWESDNNTWIVTTDNDTAFKESANFVANVLALESAGRSESWQIWLDWLQQEQRPAEYYHRSSSIRQLASGVRAVFEHVKFQDASKASRTNIQELLSQVMRLKQKERVNPNATQSAIRSQNLVLDNDGFRHSPDFRSVTLRGNQLVLTPQIAQIVQYLYEQHKNGTPDVSADSVLEHIGSGKRLRDCFPGEHRKLYKELIDSKAKGTVRLNL